MKSSRVRRLFLDFFRDRGHHEVASSSLVPADDPTLLFTNAGMVQFKRVFLGQESRPYDRATTCQKCVRAGGKHNDLEQVGLTKRHHTFFEMLGNFSFGDYFKEEAIELAWEFVTGADYLNLPAERLWVTVHHTDTEASELWSAHSSLPVERILGLGDQDNFWQMGDTGPCGPCSEIYVDLAWQPGQAAPRLDREAFEREAESGRFLEIWNLVFMQYDRAADGTLTPLPRPSVDTGAGLERIAAVLQETDDNFHTDLFQPLLDEVGQLVGRPYDDRAAERVSYRVLADHARSVAFLLADGVYPSNEGRGYVLRRILRRAVRHAWLLGRREPTLAHLTDVVVRDLGDVYPELRARGTHIRDVTRNEEERFLSTIEGGLGRLDELVAGGATEISGADAFKLYDTFGFPLDLTQLLASERGVAVDTQGFDLALEAQRTRSRQDRSQRSRAATSESEAASFDLDGADRQQFVGYETLVTEAELLAFRTDESDRAELLLSHNPFYVESGGQVSDTGAVRGDGWQVMVDAVSRTPAGVVVSGSLSGELAPGAVVAAVDEARRRDIERNHSATHLVHHILRKRLGSHVRQQGSLVEPGRLRFDFSHHGPIDPALLSEMEWEVNELVLGNDAVDVQEMALQDALDLGAMAFFADKYGDRVRVVRMGPSIELCGGTHVRSTGQVGSFRFGGQSGVAAGVRRIEALTGSEAYRAARELEGRLQQVAAMLRAQPDQLGNRVQQLLEQQARLEARLADALKQGGGTDGEDTVIGDLTVTVADTDSESRDEIGLIVDAFREGKTGAVLVLFSSSGRGAIHVAVSDDLVGRGLRAGTLVNAIAAHSGGKGGGRPQFASASAGAIDRLGEARARVAEEVRSWAGTP